MISELQAVAGGGLQVADKSAEIADLRVAAAEAHDISRRSDIASEGIQSDAVIVNQLNNRAIEKHLSGQLDTTGHHVESVEKVIGGRILKFMWVDGQA